jgi:hypothetical protein
MLQADFNVLCLATQSAVLEGVDAPVVVLSQSNGIVLAHHHLVDELPQPDGFKNCV